MKAISDDCERFISFPPGHLYSSKQGGLRRWYNPEWFLKKIPSSPYDPIVLREAFEKEGIDALEEVIYHIETYDVTTVRASTPMFLMSCKIKSLGVKMILSGEGSDEIFGGYLYFHKEEFHQETCQKIKALHLYNCLRANKSTSAWVVEARVPFLDKEFIKTAIDIDPEWKMIRPDLGRIEKWVLRKAFDDDQKPYLPKHILYRQKEQFSDGVGYSWIDGLHLHFGQKCSLSN